MMIKGITVILINKAENGRDAFNHPIYEEKEMPVENVLVAPASTTEMVDMLNLTGKKAVYNIAIPKGDNHVWNGPESKVFWADLAGDRVSTTRD